MDAEPAADAGTQLATRAELAARFGVSVSTLERLWAQRDTNGHPLPATPVTGQPGPPRPRWPVSEWGRWYEAYLAERRGAAIRTGSPDDLGGPADFARVCGHADTSTISHWLTEPPAGFPEPDTWVDLPSGRRRPQWKLGRMWAYADRRTYRGQQGGRRTRSGQDPRIDIARRALAERPAARNSELIPGLQNEHPASRSTWNRILNTARKNPG